MKKIGYVFRVIKTKFIIIADKFFNTISCGIRKIDTKIVMGAIIGALLSLVGSILVSHHYNKMSELTLKEIMKTTTDTLLKKTEAATDTLLQQITTATEMSKVKITKTVLGATEKSKKEITETLKNEITEAIAPNDFRLVIKDKEYFPNSACTIATRNPEIKFYGFIKNKSKYPAKDVTLMIFLEKNAVKESEKVIKEYFDKWFEKPRILEPTQVIGFIGRGGVIVAPIRSEGGRTIMELPFTMTTNKTTVIILVNKNEFRVIYELSTVQLKCKK